MAHESFAFSSSALRSLRLQRELLDREDRRRALARDSASRRFLPGSPGSGLCRAPPSPPRRRQICRDPAVHNALYAGDLPRVQSIFRDEATANLVLEMVSEELVWSPEQGTGLGMELGVLPFFSFLPSLPFPLKVNGEPEKGVTGGGQLQFGGERWVWGRVGVRGGCPHCSPLLRQGCGWVGVRVRMRRVHRGLGCPAAPCAR